LEWSSAREERSVVLKPETEQEPDLSGAARVIVTRAPLIVGFALVVAALVYGFTALKTEQYQATAKVRVLDPNAEAVFDNGQLRVDPKRDLDTQLELMRTDDLRADVDQALGAAAGEISGVTMSGIGATDLIAVTVSSASPQVAADAANTFASLYVERRKSQVSSAFTARADELRQKAAEIDAEIRTIDAQLDGDPTDAAALEAQRASLVAQQTDLQTRATQFDVEAATRSGNVEAAETALPPTAPFAPKPVRDAALAGLLALLVGVGVAFLLDRLDDKVHSPNDAEGAAGVPVVGAIPIFLHGQGRARKLSKSTPREVVPLDSSTAEAYRALRSNLRFSAVGAKRTSILLTSSEGSEGKSTVAANLAVVLAEAGLRVVLVSADLRKPSLSSFFGIDETEKGLTSVLIGDHDLVDCVMRVPLASGRNLYVLPAGPLPQNPAEVLGSAGLRDTLDAIERAGADFILIDSPPVLPVADALALSQFTDGVLVLTVAGRTPKGHLTETVDRLRQVNADLIGVVLNGIPTKGRYTRSYGGYGYRYGYGNTYRPESVPKKPSATVQRSGRALSELFGGKNAGTEEVTPQNPPPPGSPSNGASGGVRDDPASKTGQQAT
jgi:succinoglycan biosynthesis transport protein ExoP